MTTPKPIKALPAEGVVILVCDPQTARDIGEALEFTYASGGLDDTVRAAYLCEVADIHRAAATADRMAGVEAPVDMVPVYDLPHLRLVGGELG